MKDYSNIGPASPAPVMANHRWPWWVSFNWNRDNVIERREDQGEPHPTVGLEWEQPWFNGWHASYDTPWGACPSAGTRPYPANKVQGPYDPASRFAGGVEFKVDWSRVYLDGEVSF